MFGVTKKLSFHLVIVYALAAVLGLSMLFCAMAERAYASGVHSQQIGDDLYLGIPEGESFTEARISISGVTSGTADYVQYGSNGSSGTLSLYDLHAESVYIQSAYDAWDSKRMENFHVQFHGDNVLKDGISAYGVFGNTFALEGPGKLSIPNADYGILVEGADDVYTPATLFFNGGTVVIDSPAHNGVCMYVGNIIMNDGSLTVRNAGTDGILAMPYGLSSFGGQITVYQGFKLSSSVKNAKSYKPLNGRAVYRYDQKANPMTAKTKTLKVKAKSLKSKGKTFAAKKAFVVKNAVGSVSYKKVKGNKKITITSKGKVKVKKGLKKGTYKVKVKVKAAGNFNYKSKTKTVTLKVKVS